MSTPTADNYSAASGATVYAGRYDPGNLSGSITLGDFVASGAMGGGAPSVLGGSISLDDLIVSGGGSAGGGGTGQKERATAAPAPKRQQATDDAEAFRLINAIYAGGFFDD